MYAFKCVAFVGNTPHASLQVTKGCVRKTPEPGCSAFISAVVVLDFEKSKGHFRPSNVIEWLHHLLIGNYENRKITSQLLKIHSFSLELLFFSKHSKGGLSEYPFC